MVSRSKKISQQFPGRDTLLQEFGFRSGKRGTHSSRTIMLADLCAVLAHTPVDAAHEEYRTAIMEENVLGKGTASTRYSSWKRLRELYGLDPRLAVFRCFRQLWESDSPGRPLLTVLCACARDPLLRMSATVILNTPIDSVVSPEHFAKAIQEAAPDRFSPTTLKAVSNRCCSSWTQSGHLNGSKVRKRSHPVVSPQTAAFALVLGRLAGARGPLLFSTFWTALLEASAETVIGLALAASQRGLIDFRRVGSIVEVGFCKLLSPKEQEVLRESG